MARKVTVQKSNTIDVWMQKVNQTSDYVNDLDNLDNTFNPGETWDINYPNIRADSSIVGAINHLRDFSSSVFGSLVTGTSPARQPFTIKIFADSADFDKINTRSLYNFDAGMTRNDFFGDSPGTAKFDFNADSAKFENLNALRLRQHPDSATFGRLTLGGDGFITNLSTVDSTAEIVFGNLQYNGAGATGGGGSALIDSALVLDRIQVREFISDSGGDSGINIGVARIVQTIVDSSITFTDSPSLNFNVLRPFYILDSQGITTLYDNSVTYFAAYQLIDSS